MKNLFLSIAVVILASCSSSRFSDDVYTYNNENGIITVSDNESAYQIEVYRSDMIKTTYLPDKNDKPIHNDLFVILNPVNDLSVKIRETSSNVSIQTDEITVEISKSPFEINYFDHEGLPLLINSRNPVSKDEEQTLFFDASHINAFYGMGQKSIPVNRIGEAFRVFNHHVGGYSKKEYGTMQVNIPYVYTDAGFGVFFDNTYTGYFDLAKSNSSEWSYKIDGGTYCYYISTGESLQNLQNDYYDLTGYPTLPPKWVFGLMQSKCGYIDEAEVYSVVDKFEQYNLPLDAIILDAFWFGGYGDDYPQLMGNFTWLKDHFPDPKGYMAALKEKGIKTLTINEPQINVNSENHAMLMQNDWLMKVDGEPFIQSSFWAGSASLLDLTVPEAREWLWEKQKANVELGLDAFWVDLTEPDVSTPEGMFQAGPEKKIHNIYSYLFARTLWEGFQKDFPNKRLYNITRAGTAGMQRFGAFHWSGDASKTFLALEIQVPMMIGAAMSGMAHYSSDIGGFTNAWDTISVPWTEYKGGKGVTSPELYTRWFQFGVFSPVLRPHSGEDQSCEPFAFDEKTLRITKEFLKLRYRLIPFLYSYAHKTSSVGEQLIRPMFMEFDDSVCDTLDYQYMFGKEFLVAPVLFSGVDHVDAYLPLLPDNNKWIDFWTDNQFESGQWIKAKVDMNSIPVFIKQPSVIPLAKVKKFVDESPDDTLTVLIYPGGEGEFELYEDDGKTYDYEKNKYSVTKISTNKMDDRLVVNIPGTTGNYEGAIDKRTWIFDLRLIKNVGEITLNGNSLDDDQVRYISDRNQLKIYCTESLANNINIEISGCTLVTE